MQNDQIDTLSMEMVMKVQVSHHAGVRMQQRAISANILDILMEFGQEKFDGHGGKIITFTKPVIKELKAQLAHKDFVQLERHPDLYAVVSLDKTPTLITTGYRTHHMRLH